MDLVRSYIKGKKRMYSSCHNLWKCDEIYPRSLTDYVAKINEVFHFDACIVHYFYLTKLFEKIHIPIKALSTHDSFAYRNIRVKDDSLFLTANDEAKAMQRSTHIFALQESEKHYFEHLSPLSQCVTVYNYYEFHSSSLVGNRNILFLSSLNPYNVSGIKWFLDNVLPMLCAYYPGCKLIVGGTICDVLSFYKNRPEVELQGYVDNVERFYSQGDIAINPVSNGTGMKIKTFESISFDKITIVHPHSTEGIYKNEDAPLLCSDQVEEWIDNFHKVWDDVDFMRQIKKKNRSYIEDMNKYILNQYSLVFG